MIKRKAIQINLYSEYNTDDGQSPFPIGNMRRIFHIAEEIVQAALALKEWGAEVIVVGTASYDSFLMIEGRKDLDSKNQTTGKIEEGA